MPEAINKILHYAIATNSPKLFFSTIILWNSKVKLPVHVLKFTGDVIQIKMICKSYWREDKIRTMLKRYVLGMLPRESLKTWGKSAIELPIANSFDLRTPAIANWIKHYCLTDRQCLTSTIDLSTSDSIIDWYLEVSRR